MSLELDCRILRDPDGHQGALLLKGDWLYVLISDGKYTGIGEASHSGNDAHCVCKIYDLFERHIRKMDLSYEAVQALEAGPFLQAENLLAATAISGLNQALYDLLARREGVPVWQLFTNQMRAPSVPLYTTINRVLTTRSDQDYLSTVQHALNLGYTQLKCAPFEKVTPDSDQVKAAGQGLQRLRMLFEHFPGLDLRVDFHSRFTMESFLEILPELESLNLHWIEEPCPLGTCYADLRRLSKTALAGGELFFGSQGFLDLAQGGCVDVVMPDIKHVGGFQSLLSVCKLMENCQVQVSPHNPSSPLSTIASAHAAAISPAITSLEIPLRSYGVEPALAPWQEKERLSIPHTPGWGIALEDILS